MFNYNLVLAYSYVRLCSLERPVITLKEGWKAVHLNMDVQYVSLAFYLHGPPLGKGDHNVLPLPVLLHHMGKDDMAVATGPCQLGTICRPGQAEHAAGVGLL